MGFIGGSIPGHSGTQFKHRKAFSIAKILQNENARKISSLTKFERSHIDDYQDRFSKESKLLTITKMVILGVIVSCLIAIFIHLTRNHIVIPLKSRINYENEMKIINKAQEALENQTAYKVLLTSGNNFLRTGFIDEAQWEFVRALRIDNSSNPARIGILQVLDNKCQNYGVYCKEAEENRIYINQIDLLENQILVNR